MTNSSNKFAEPERNKAQFELLHSFYLQHPWSVLTPAILRSWDDIHIRSEEAWRYSFDSEMFSAASRVYCPPPQFLENIIPPGTPTKLDPVAKDMWLHSEKFFYWAGFRTDHFEHHDTGRESIVFRMNNVKDLLLKCSCVTKLGGQDMPILMPYGREIIRPKGKKTHVKALSFALSPYMGGTLTAKEGNEQTLEEMYLPFRFFFNDPEKVSVKNVNDVERVLNACGLTLVDRKPTNIRHHTQYPHLAFVTDRRAVEELSPDVPKRKVVLSAAERAVFQELQRMLTGQFFVKYGLLAQEECNQRFAKKLRAEGRTKITKKDMIQEGRMAEYFPFIGVAVQAQGKGWAPDADWTDMWEHEGMKDRPQRRVKGVGLG